MKAFHKHFYGGILPSKRDQTMGRLPRLWDKPEHDPIKFNLLHIAANYRNPISHGDAIVGTYDAQTQLGLHLAVIVSMLTAIEDNP